MAVRTAISKLDSTNMHKERSERFVMRKKYLEEAGLGDMIQPVTSQPNSPSLSKGEEKKGEITRKSLEDDARNQSLRESNPNTRFWNHQQGWQETEKVGLKLIEQMELRSDGKKDQ
jgi:anoctamin-10